MFGGGCGGFGKEIMLCDNGLKGRDLFTGCVKACRAQKGYHKVNGCTLPIGKEGDRLVKDTGVADDGRENGEEIIHQDMIIIIDGGHGCHKAFEAFLPAQ